MNLPTIAKVVFLALGVMGGTVAAPEAFRMVSEITGATDIPEGQIPNQADPNSPLAVWKNTTDVVNSAQTRAIDTNTAAVEALRAEILELEGRLAAQRRRGDSNVSERVTTNTEEIKTLKGIVQP